MRVLALIPEAERVGPIVEMRENRHARRSICQVAADIARTASVPGDILEHGQPCLAEQPRPWTQPEAIWLAEKQAGHTDIKTTLTI